MNRILIEQLAIDLCCTPEEIESPENVFTVYTPHPDRRVFKEGECFLKAVCVNGKLVATGKPEIVGWVMERYGSKNGAWFMDVPNLRELDEQLRCFGCRVGFAHPFYIAEKKTPMNASGCQLRFYRGDELEQFRGDPRFDEAFLFETLPRDEIGVAAVHDGEILGMAGATSDSRRMWQIGINVLPEARGKGVGTALVTAIKNEILELGRLPFYGTALSHIVSQRVALGAGFFPAWAELNCERLPKSSVI